MLRLDARIDPSVYSSWSQRAIEWME